MSLPSELRWFDRAALPLVFAALVAGCAHPPGQPLQASPADCARFLATAQAALATTDSAGLPTAHAQHAAAMHEYHVCLADLDAADVTTD